MKALATLALLAGAFGSTTLSAVAGTLVTGAVRDRDGLAVAGARITATDARGIVVGRDASASDGTFAIDAARQPAALAVTCTYCETSHAEISDGEPAILIVRRYRTLRDGGPSAADLAALPYRRLADVASIVPFVLADRAGVSDRGLNRGRGAVLLDGVPFYRTLDGLDPVLFTPSRAAAALAVRSPLVGPRYGSYANGGTFDMRTTDPEARAAIDGGSAFDLGLRGNGANVGGAYDESSDAGDHRTLAALTAAVPFAGGTLSGAASALGDDRLHDVGGSLRYATGSRRYETFASVDAARSQYDGTSFRGSDDEARADLHVRTRGAPVLEAGARVRRSMGAFRAVQGSYSGSQQEDALYADVRFGNARSSLTAAAALQRNVDTLDDIRPVRTTAILSSLAYDGSMNERWSIHAGAAGGLREPTLVELEAAANPAALGFDRTSLFELAVRYTDAHRVRLEAMTYTERIPGPASARVAGSGLSGVWQITPLLSLRAWTLRSNARNDILSPASGRYAYTQNAALRAHVLWFTYGNAVRVDALARGGPLEGDVILPLGRYALALGTVRRDARRITTVGLRTR